MERSQHYTDAIDKARHAPTQPVRTDEQLFEAVKEAAKTYPEISIQKLAQHMKERNYHEERERKHERAQELRMELWLDNARLTEFICQSLLDDPSMDESSLRQMAEQSGLIVHPKATERLVTELLRARDESVEQINSFQSEVKAGDNAYKILLLENRKASSLFKRALDYWFYKPHGTIHVDLSYPLAIVLTIEDPTDFAKIDTRQNIGGFFSRKGNSRKYPIIVVGPSSVELGRVPRVRSHEEGHAENNAYKMATTNKKLFWSNAELPDTKVINGKLATLPQEKLRNTTEYNTFLDYALSSGQDELLADFKAVNNLSHLNNLKQPGSTYDYFANDLAINPDSELYALLWEDYNRIIDEAVKAANGILQGYDQVGLSRRTELLRWVLAQVSLKSWPRQLEATLFIKEKDYLIAIVEKRAELAQYPGLNSVILKKVDAILRTIREQQTQNIYPLVVELHQRFCGDFIRL